MLVSNYLQKSCMYYKQKKMPQFLLLTVNISSKGIASTLNSIFSLQNRPQCLKEFALGCIVVGSSIIRNKGKLVKMTTRCQLLPFVVTHYHSLPVVVTHCDSLSLVVPLVVTRCTTRCDSLYHLLPFDVSLICLFIKNCIFYWKLIPGKKDFIFSSTKNLFRLFKAAEINLVKNIFSFTIRIMD